MQILAKIDQAAALRRGYDAPHSTERIDVDPSTLTEIEREVLAAILVDGYDATQRGLRAHPDDDDAPVDPVPIAAGNRGAVGVVTLCLTRPGVEGLREDIAHALEHVRALRQERADERADEIAQLHEWAAATDWAATEEITITLYADGTLRGCGSGVLDVAAVVPVVPVAPYSRFSDARLDARILARRGARYEAIEAAREAALPRLREILAELERAKADRQAAYDALYARLPQALRDRDADGYTAQGEIDDAIHQMIRTDAGYAAQVPDWQMERTASVLSDEGHARLRAAREAAPEGAEIEVLTVWDQPYRRATDDDDPDDIDDDGEVWDPRGYRRVAVITWDHPSGLRGRAVEVLEELG